MEHKLTVSTEDPELIRKIIALIKGKSATYQLEKHQKTNEADLCIPTVIGVLSESWMVLIFAVKKLNETYTRRDVCFDKGMGM